MKKRLALLPALCLAVSLAACAPAATPTVPDLPDLPDETASAQSTPPAASESASSLPDELLENYGITNEEFLAFATILNRHIEDEWEEPEPYNADLQDVFDTLLRMAAQGSFSPPAVSGSPADIINDTFETWIASQRRAGELDELGEKRAAIFGHALTDWVRQENIDLGRLDSFLRTLSQKARDRLTGMFDGLVEALFYPQGDGGE